MDLTVAGVLIVPLIIGLVEALRRTGLPARWAPVAAVLLGVLIAAGDAVVNARGDPSAVYGAVLSGVALGLAAVGLYSGTKNTVKSL